MDIRIKQTGFSLSMLKFPALDLFKFQTMNYDQIIYINIKGLQYEVAKIYKLVQLNDPYKLVNFKGTELKL